MEIRNNFLETEVGVGAGCSWAGVDASSSADCFAKRAAQGFGEACYSSGTCTLASSCDWLKAKGFKCCFGSYNDESCDWHSLASNVTNEEDVSSLAVPAGAGEEIGNTQMETEDLSSTALSAGELMEIGNNWTETLVGAGAGCSWAGVDASSSADCFAKRAAQGFGEACYSSGHCTLASSCDWLKANGFKCCFGSYNDESCDWHN
jgi:hypothetical protein